LQKLVFFPQNIKLAGGPQGGRSGDAVQENRNNKFIFFSMGWKRSKI
jgi:hypothetical protein